MRRATRRCAEGVEAAVDVAVAAVDLLDVLYGAGALGAHGRDEQRHAGADVGRRHARGAQGYAAVVAYDGGAVRVAEDDLRTHVDELVDEEEAALEHLLVYEHGTLCLRRHHEEYRQQVGREAGPRGVGDGHYGAVDEALDGVVLLLGNVYVVAALLEAYSEAGELCRYDAEVVVRDILYRKLRLRHGGHADEAAHLDHVGQQGVFGAVELPHALYGEQVRGYARDTGAHAVEHAAELLHVGFAGGVVDGGDALGEDGGHDYVGGTCHGGFVEEHVAPLEAFCLYREEPLGLVEVECGAEFLESEEVRVEAAAADLVASGLGYVSHSEACQQRAYHHDRAAETAAAAVVVVAAQVVEVDVCGAERVAVAAEMPDLDAHCGEQLDELHDVEYLGYVVHDDALGCEQRGAEYL